MGCICHCKVSGLTGKEQSANASVYIEQEFQCLFFRYSLYFSQISTFFIFKCINICSWTESLSKYTLYHLNKENDPYSFIFIHINPHSTSLIESKAEGYGNRSSGIWDYFSHWKTLEKRSDPKEKRTADRCMTQNRNPQ